MNIYDVIIVGGGAAGCMAGVFAGERNKSVLLLERNDSIGKKILISGKGRCNVTNAAPIETFVEKFGVHGRSLRNALYAFSNTDVMSLFAQNDCPLKVERQDRVFPETDSAQSIVNCLLKLLNNHGVDIRYNTYVSGVRKAADTFCVSLHTAADVFGRSVILATGGASYPGTGSTGDGYRFAKEFGHTVIQPVPGLVPLVTREQWVKKVQGLALKNVRVSACAGKKKITTPLGELLFTHFGVSGPLILDASYAMLLIKGSEETISLTIDCKPALSDEQIEKRIMREIKENGNATIQSLIHGFLPRKLGIVVIRLGGFVAERKVHQITREERKRLIGLLKALPLTVSGSLPIAAAMVTGGGIPYAEVNPKSMESRKQNGLFFCGELLEGCAPSGGYNLQQAFSTGFLAGTNAS